MSELAGGVVVASNRAAAGVYEDATGPLLVEFLRELGIATGEPVVVPDGEPVGAAIAAFVIWGAGGGDNPTHVASPGTTRVLQVSVTTPAPTASVKSATTSTSTTRRHTTTTTTRPSTTRRHSTGGSGGGGWTPPTSPPPSDSTAPTTVAPTSAPTTKPPTTTVAPTTSVTSTTVATSTPDDTGTP